MDIRPPAYRQHRPPLDSFRVWSGNQSLRLLSADFTELYNLLEKTVARLPLFGVSGWTLRGVTPSFHPSEYQFSKISGIIVPSTLCASFPSGIRRWPANVSHDCHSHILQEGWWRPRHLSPLQGLRRLTVTKLWLSWRRPLYTPFQNIVFIQFQLFFIIQCGGPRFLGICLHLLFRQKKNRLRNVNGST